MNKDFISVNVGLVQSAPKSILDAAFLKALQEISCHLMERDNAVCPALFLLLSGEQVANIVFDQLPGSFGEKYAMLQAVGVQMSQNHGSFTEAVMISEGWMVLAEKDKPLDLSVMPSKHPNRKEVITIVGKNVGDTISKVSILPFSRDGNKIKWEDPIQTDKDITHFTGILDALFSDYKE